MRNNITNVLIAGLLMTGCAQQRAVEPDQSAANPLIPQRVGLFGSSGGRTPEQVPTTPIANVTNLTVERIPGGAIVRATGIDQRQGAFNLALVPQNEAELPVDGVLTYTMERRLPEDQSVSGPAQTREVVVARKLTDQQLRGVRSIRVSAAQNSLSVGL
jgi:hypothetical protein